MDEPRGRHTRGYLPHIEAGPRPQFITWRLADSVPGFLIDRWRAEFSELPERDRHLKLNRRMEQYLDEGHGSCVLRNPVAARIVQEAILKSHGALCVVHDWVVMPNHVHLLATPNLDGGLSKLVQSIKGRTSREVHLALGGEGRLWQPEYFDRLIRDAEHFERVGHYIRRNPVKAGLCSEPGQWPWSSANRGVVARLEQSGSASSKLESTRPAAD